MLQKLGSFESSYLEFLERTLMPSDCLALEYMLANDIFDSTVKDRSSRQTAREFEEIGVSSGATATKGVHLNTRLALDFEDLCLTVLLAR